MRRIISLILSIAILFCFNKVYINADAQDIVTEHILSTTIEYLDDGTILEITVTENISFAMTLANTYVKTGSKTYTNKNADGDTLWWFKLSGQYSVNEGVSSVCTSSWYSHSVLNDNWSLKSASTSKSGSKALAEATFIRKVLFITAETKEISLTLTCDKNGNLS